MAYRPEANNQRNTPSVHDAHSVLADHDMPFRRLMDLDGAFDRVQCTRVKHDLLRQMMLVDSPGMLDTGIAGYDYDGIVREFADKAALHSNGALAYMSSNLRPPINSEI